MLRPLNIVYGADPEGFFSKSGSIIGSERVIPKGGLKGDAITPHVIRDGVQFELNPPARRSVALLGREISNAFELLSRQMRKVSPTIQLDWRGLVEVPQEELDNLSGDTRVLGCNPSENVYGDFPIRVDPLTYRKRSAGGHPHFGLTGVPILYQHRTKLVKILDAIVGNTCVLFDRDPGAAERRENYGRAGEYRKPKHGLEYRTLSNFWLRNYTLMSAVFGLSDIAFAVYAGGVLPELAKVVNLNRIREAIDTNNANLALANFDRMRPFLATHLPPKGFVLNPDNLGRVVTFSEGIRKHGLAAFFPTDPVVHWLNREQTDFSTFLNTLY